MKLAQLIYKAGQVFGGKNPFEYSGRDIIPGVMSKTYDYYADGTLRFSSDLLDHRFDRFYSFDHLNRLKDAFSGAEARGEPQPTTVPTKKHMLTTVLVI